ncbi:MAG: amino acid adenylation domain-containing protein, partial [Candidatus Eremiobacterota bacterium]
PYWLEILKEHSMDEALSSFFEITDSCGETLTASASVKNYKISLDSYDTELLLKTVPSAFNTKVTDILLSALLLASNRSFQVSDLVLNVEGDGREAFIGDVSRTAGWFNTVFPVHLKSPSLTDYGTVIKSVKETLRAVPDNGLSYQLLKYFSDIKEDFREDSLPLLTFNYSGRSVLPENELLSTEEFFDSFSLSQMNKSLLDIKSFLSGNTLSAVFSGNGHIRSEENLKEFAHNFIDSLKEIIYHCIKPGRKYFTPSDFPLATVPQSFLDSITDPSSIEVIYGLSPLQEGFLFHAMSSPDADHYCTQASWSYEGELHIDALKDAWNGIFSAHSAFRTGFVWEKGDKPFQIVYRHVPLPWHTVDLRGKTGEEQERIIEDTRGKTRHSLCNLKNPPVCSLYLFIMDTGHYRFLWSYHHIILDGWSMPLILRELNKRYDSIVNKEHVSFPCPKSFESYIKWLSLQDDGELIDYWKNSLSDFSAPTPLMVNRSRLEIHKAVENPGEYTYRLPESFLAECQKFARSSGVTLNALVQLAWSSVLSCYSGSEDILYGTTVSGRPPALSGVEEMIGLFINTIPLRVILNRDETAIYNLKHIQDIIQNGNNLSHISLSKLQSMSSIPPGEALFYSIFVFENFPFSQEMLGLKNIKMYGKSTYPMNVVIVAEKELSISISYDRDSFSDDVIENLACHIEHGLQWIVRNPEDLLKNIDIVSEKEKHLLLNTFNDTCHDVPKEKTIHELIESQVALNSERTAVVYKDDKLTYGELNEKANKLAHFLRREGVTRDSRVGIFLDRSCHMIVSILAVLKAGGAFVPIDPHYPSDRINYIISDSGSIMLITEPSLAGNLNSSVKIVDVTDSAIYTGESDNLPFINTSHDLVYMIYTSGSTGQPKGVMIEHHSLVNLCCYYKNTYSFSEHDNMAKYVSFGFDASIPEIFPALISGSGIHIIPEEIRLSPSKLNEYFERNDVTLAILPTQFGEQFMLLTDNRSLRWLELGGDKLKTFKKQNYTVVNGYGPTEYTVCTSDFVIDKYYENIPIGKPIYNTKVYILDKYGKITPAGIPGELCVSGEGVARGYLNREELTEEKFVKNPFISGERMYRTGDLARWLPDGNLEFLGRIDAQVKIRGFRIELGEIEEALKKIDPVKDAVVIDRIDKQGNKYLCAYYISDIKLKSSDLQKELSLFLPDYMIPSCFLKIDEIPVTSHGKIDRKALPVPSQSDLASHETYVAPRNEREEILAVIWKEVLNCDRVGIYDNFFSLGGDSIMSIQIAARANNEGIHITASTILRNPTIASLSSEIKEKSAVTGEQDILSGDVPLIPVQEWFFEREFTELNYFNQSFLFTLKQDVAAEVIEKTLNILQTHHDGLRLRFKFTDGEEEQDTCPGTQGKWLQWYESPEKSHIPVETAELSAISAQSEFITEKCTSIQSSLDITEGPTVRAVMFKGHSDGRDRLFIAVHHLCIDMVSWRIIIEDFHSIYRSISCSETPSLPPKTSSYREWSFALRKYNAEAHRDYWFNVLRDIPTLPVEYKESKFSDIREYKVRLPVQETDLLINEISSVYNTQINDILLSALLLAFNRALNVPEVIINLEGHGREEITEEVDLSRTAGWFTSIFPVRLKSSSREPGTIIKSVKEILRSVPDKGLSYGVLRYLSEDKEDLKKLECRRVGFNYLGQIDSSILDGELLCGTEESVGPSVSPENGIINLLDMNGFVSKGILSMMFTYSSNIWKEETVKHIGDSFIESLKEIIEHCVKTEGKHFTPSDFPLAAVTQSFLDTITESSSVESIYGLTPLQEGMLFHTIYAPGSDEYSMQIYWHYREDIDEGALRASWEKVISRHTILRSAFVWHDMEKPAQIVYRDVPIPWHREDWTSLQNIEEKLEKYLLSDRNAGFDLTKPCLMRFHLIKLEPDHYIFVWTSHHIIQDGWSLPVITGEVTACYRAFIENKQVELPESPPYEEYIKWFRNVKKSETEKYWKEYVKGFSVPTPLNIGRRSVKSDSHGYMPNVKETGDFYPESFAAQVSEFAKDHKITINILLQMAWAIVLSKYSGYSDVLFGATVSGRPAELRGVENMVGLFINAVPVRTRIDENINIISQLAEAHESFQTSSNHFMISLNEIKSFTDLSPDSPFFDSIFVYQNYPIRDVKGTHEKLNPVDLGAFERTNYSITLSCGMTEKISMRVLYDGDTFEESVIKRLIAHIYEAALWIMKNPEKSIKDAEIIPQREKEELLYGFNRTEWPYDRNLMMKDLLEEGAEKYGDNTAVVYKDEKLSYRELNEKANALARVLREKGIGRGKSAGIFIDRSLEMVIAVIAVVKAGGVYIPVDHEYPPSRIEYMLKDSDSSILITRQELAEKLDFEGTVLYVDDEKLYEGDRSNLSSVNVPEDAVTIIYTSGSTGNPKGVITKHLGLTHFCLWYKETRHLTPEDNTTKFVSFGFDVTMWEIFPTLMSGAALHIIESDIRLSPHQLNDYFEKNNITVSFLPTQLCEQFMALTDNKSLRWLDTAGEKLRTYTKRNYTLVNGYGPTEYTDCISWFIVDRPYENIPIGKPISNTRVYILGEDGKLVPPCVPGELCVAGHGMTGGYLNRADLTESKYVDNPFVPGEKMYRTGDLARWLSDGNIEYMGRIDTQVKIRGFRIELSEIEQTMKKIPWVADAAVIDRDDESGRKYLCAYYVPGKDCNEEDETGKIKTFIKETLPDYMTPQFIMKIDVIPLTPNGKIDRKSLPAPDESIIKEEFIPPSTEAEKKLSAIWEEILGVRAGMNNNFFDLGGHSLKAVTLQSKIQKEFDITISLKDIFKYSTLKEMSLFIERGSKRVVSISHAPEMEYYPVSSAQRRMFLMDQLEGKSITYNTPIVFIIEGAIDHKKLSDAIDKVVSRHESLRTSFHIKDGEPVQKIHETVRVKRIYREGEEEDIDGILKEFIRPFDLSRVPLLRFALIKTGPKRYVFMLDIHHIIFDGVSFHVFMNELMSFYQGKDIQPLTIQYKDFAFWHENLLKSGEINRQKQYWLDVYEGDIPVLNLITDKPRPSEMSFHGHHRVYSVDRNISSSFKAMVNRKGSTLFMTGLACFSLLLSRYTSQEDIIIGTPGTGRNIPDIDSLIGMFVNTLAIRTSPVKEKIFADFLKETEERILSAYDNQDYQLDMLIDDLGIKRDAGRNPLFDVMFDIVNKQEKKLIEDINLEPYPLEVDVAKFDLTMTIVEEKEDLYISIEYRDDLFMAETIDRMAEHYINLLGDICRKKEGRLKDMDILSESEKHRLLHEFNKTSMPYNLNRTIHEVIEDSALKHSEKIAVVCKDRRITYSELNRQSDILAEKLLSAGVKDNEIVAIMISQKLEMIPGILGILKSGCAFLPIDPSYPSERIEFMMEDAGVSVLLTETQLKTKVKFGGHIICLDEDSLWEGTVTEGVKRGKPSDLAYIIYTSGTTGKPKGVMIEHSSLVNLSLYYRDVFTISSQDRGTKYAGFSFDAGISEIFPFLIAGAAIHIIPDEMRLSLKDINLYFKENNITHTFLPTQFAEQFMELEENTSLKYLDTGGDKVRFFKQHDYKVVNGYGPTEYTGITTTFTIERMYDNIPIGKPVANTDIYILDRNGLLTPVGVPGELHISGAGISRGYLGRPDLTAEKFVNNPFRPGEKMYRTGDLSRWLPDGNIEFLGRMDEQVKVRGYRIELGEIEHTIKEYSEIKDVVLIAHEIIKGDKTLCAYIVSDHDIDIEQLRDFLRKTLPDYMVPAYFIKMDKIPLTPNGKVDRKKLVPPDFADYKKEIKTPKNES